MGKRKEARDEATYSDDSDPAPKIKKPYKRERRNSVSPQPEVQAEAQAAPVVRKTSEGESYVQLGKKKRATVRKFKGMIMVDIREFYGEDGDEKPGKKGISLLAEQWDALKRSADVIDSLIAAQVKT